jgi:hypothetical protein
MRTISVFVLYYGGFQNTFLEGFTIERVSDFWTLSRTMVLLSHVLAMQEKYEN